ncbi:MAG TPA: N-acetyltransferase [Anaeromyxobacteraceae bacterium]|nr:N-acetyltransferase [Anaeromyxobacteraceae bacterium]
MTSKPEGAPLATPMHARPPGDVEVAPVLDGLDKDLFVRFPERIYRDDLHWVPPLLMERHDFLDPRKNPFFAHADVALFLARRGGEVVGRIAAVEDRNFNAFQHSRTAYFGLYESVNDPGVAAALFATARGWARARGLDTLLGPMNLSTNYEVGLLVEGFDSDPYFMMPYNPRHYAALFEACGLRKAKDLFAWERSAASPPPERFARIADRIRKAEGITIRSVDLSRFDAEVARIKEVYNAAWEQNWGFVPMTEAEFDKLARDLKQLVVPELALIVEDGGEPVAFSLTLPDLNQALKKVGGRLTWYGLPLGLARLLWHQRRIDRVRLMALGVKSGWRRRGLDAVLIVESIRRTRALGYRGGEVSWTLEDNELINRAIESVGCSRSKVYRVYQSPTE